MIEVIKMEEEIRFYYSYDKYDELLKKLRKMINLTYGGCYLELTIQYDHPMSELSFYNKNVDGRLRLRSSKNMENKAENGKISWKRRLTNTQKGLINNEEEVEVNLQDSKQIENIKYLFEQVLKLKKIESYQRYRNVFYNNDIEIAVDKYPFGIALEIENKSNEKEAINTIKYWADKIGVDIKKAYRLSWDDKYTSLCNEQNIKPVKNVIFDNNVKMPQVK